MCTDLMDLSLQLHSPSPSQIPLVWPRVTQLAEQAQLPRVHRNPALTRLLETSKTNTGVSEPPNILLTKITKHQLDMSERTLTCRYRVKMSLEPGTP